MAEGHQWCYQGDMLVDEVSPHRQEWCAKCGTVRVQFSLGWFYQISDLARANPCKGEDTFLSKVPERSMTRVSSSNRLGRGLKELMDKAAPMTVKGLLPISKDDNGD